jgi:hypothetical protein
MVLIAGLVLSSKVALRSSNKVVSWKIKRVLISAQCTSRLQTSVRRKESICEKIPGQRLALSLIVQKRQTLSPCLKLTAAHKIAAATDATYASEHVLHQYVLSHVRWRCVVQQCVYYFA